RDADAGVVYQDVDAAELADRFLGELFDGAPLRNVRRKDDRRTPLSLDQSSQLLQRRAVSRGERQPRATPSEFERDRPANALRGAGDDDARTPEVHPSPSGGGSGWGLMLAATTEVGRLASGGQFGNAVTTAWTLLLSLGVDPHEAAVLLVRLVLWLGLDRLDCLAQDFSGRSVEPNDFIRLERRALSERQQACLVQDLVRVGVADAGDEGLVAQQIFELARVPADALRELGQRDGQRVGT